MLRTRDFILLFTTIVFLVLAIGFTIVAPSLSPSPTSNTFIPAEPVDTIGAEVETTILDRSTRAANLRNKIAESGEVILSAPVPEPSTPSSQEEEMVIANDSVTPQQCPQYQLYRGSWPLVGVEIVVTDVSRQYSIPQPAIGTSTPEGLLLLSLPVYPVVQGSLCLPSDVVGVALDGSLIRNSEASLYSVFGAETLIGFALDGFPVFGLGGAGEVLDECGGIPRSDGYRYQLAAARDHVLSCFRAAPKQLP